MRENPVLPTISVIVPVHNGQDYLKNCIDSILAQTYRPLEIIVVNDGSADRTGEICAALEKAHENIFTVEVKDVGVSAARNAGLDRAHGEYVTFVDADDRIHPEMLTVLYRNLVRTGSDISGCSFFAWQTEKQWESGTLGAGSGGSHNDSVAQKGEENGQDVRLFTQKEFALEGILKKDTRCWSKLYKKECIQNVRFREGLTIGEDMLFLIDLLPNVKRIVSADFQGYGYFQNPHGAMNRSFKPGYMDQIACWKLAEEALAKWIAGEASGGEREERTVGRTRTNIGARAVYQKQQRLTAQERAFVEETIAARQMIGIMLTVGKLAELPGKERKANRQYVKICRQSLKECLAAGKGMAGLDRGYRMKVRLFAVMPGAYVQLYGSLKRWSKKL